MSVIVARPPNFELILKAFPHAADPGILFAYGDDIYVPSATGGTIDLPPELLAHEAVHGRRQLTLFTPDHWWEMYLTDPGFRYNEELLAHVAEYKERVRGLRDRNLLAQHLTHKAQRLIAPLYNYQPPRTLQQAIRDMRRELDK